MTHPTSHGDDTLNADSDQSVRDGTGEHGGRRKKKLSDLSQGPGLLEMVACDDPEEIDLAARSSSVIKFYPDWCKCLDCLLRNSDDTRAPNSCSDQCKDAFRCPPTGTMGRLLVFTILCLCLWGLMFFLLRPMSKYSDEYDDNRNPAWLEGPLFALIIVEVTGLLVGFLLKRFINFPALLGPLVLGILYNNIQTLNVFNLMVDFQYRDKHIMTNGKYDKQATDTIDDWVKPIRLIALGIILTRAGLELSPKQLKKLKGIVPLLAFGPCIVEASCCALCNYIFFNVMEVDKKKMNLPMCFVGGFALAAVSPAVVVPTALSLKRDGYGVVKGIPTLLIAASSIDDVLAISAYTIALGFAIKSHDSSGSEWQSYSGGIIGICIGLAHGIICGMILHFIPPRKSKNKPQHRIILLLLINFLSVLFYEDKWFGSAGSISVLTTSFIAGFGWRSQPHWKRPMHQIEGWLAHLWVLWVPLIFGTIGKEIDFSSSSYKGSTLLKTFGVIFISLFMRCLSAFGFVSWGTNFNVKERIFIALSWIPKATVQAALAPLVKTMASESIQKDYENANSNADIVVNVAILAVLITAPIGCILMTLTGPRLLQKPVEPDHAIEEEFPNGGGFDPAESMFGLVQATAARMSLRQALNSDHNIHSMRSLGDDLSEALAIEEKKVPEASKSKTNV